MVTKEVKARHIGRGGAVRWVVLGAVALFGVLLLAGCNTATAQDSSADELAQQRQENSDLQKQIEELEDEQDERNEADLQRQIDELEAAGQAAGAAGGSEAAAAEGREVRGGQYAGPRSSEARRHRRHRYGWGRALDGR